MVEDWDLGVLWEAGIDDPSEGTEAAGTPVHTCAVDLIRSVLESK